MRNIPELPEGFPTPEILGGVGPGWWPIIEELHKQLLTIDPDYTLGQVKEKFGQLRYYVTFKQYAERDSYSLGETAISLAEALSLRYCENCGTSNDVTTGGVRPEAPYSWVKTLCPTCRGEW